MGQRATIERTAVAPGRGWDDAPVDERQRTAASDAVAALRRRAEALRARAPEMGPVVAQAYRRRAAEVELHAWLLAVHTGQETGPPVVPAA